MQFLVFHLGADRYGLDTRRLVRVLPLMGLKQLPQAPACVAGLMNYRGAAVPVIDLGMLACGRPCAERFDSRILLADYRGADGVGHLLGVVVESVAGVEVHDPRHFAEPGVATPEAPYLGRVLSANGALLQWVELEQLLSPELRALLFQPEVQAAPC